MEVTENSLYTIYNDMDTDELLGFYRDRKHTLSDSALGVLDQVISDRNITSLEKEKLKEQINKLDKQRDKDTELYNSLAPMGSRFLARVLDAITGMTLYLMPVVIFGNSYILVGVITATAYFLLQDALPNGQSIGKRVLNIAVINKETGEPCGVYRSINRNGLLYFTGYIDLLFLLSKYQQRLGDMVANTTVVKVIRSE